MKRLAALFLIAVLPVLSAAEITLAENGQAKAGIVIPVKAKPIVQLAARELAEHLKQMTGAEFKISRRPAAKVNFYLGFGDAANFGPDEYVIEAAGDRIDIYGKDTPKRVQMFNYFYDNPDKGTLRGVHNFLDSLGVRWLAPGKGGTYVPVRKTLRIPERKIHFKPFYRDRQIADGWNFIRKHPDAKEYVKSVDELFLWGIRNNVSTRNMVPGGHSERSLGLFKNPEWLKHTSAHQQMKDGRRNPNYSCWTDPYTREVWLRAVEGYFSGKSPQECGFTGIKGYIDSKWPMPFISPDEFMIDPMDHSTGNDGRCWCDRCQEFRKQHPCPDDTEIIWKVIGGIAQTIKDKYPGRYISTLVYPPKKSMPRKLEKTGNIRVRICLPGARSMIFPDQLEYDLKLLKSWGDLLGPKNIPLWVYQCTADFGRFLPGVPDVYPNLTAQYLRTMKPYCAGISCENHQQTHTFRNMDVYIFMRLVWDPDRDVKKELEAYFRLYYGPAAEPARKLFELFENNWIRIDRMICTNRTGGSNQIGIVRANKDQYQRMVWSEVYTPAEMNKIDSLLKKMEASVPAGSVYARRVGLLRKYLFGVMKAERSEVMDKEENRKKLNLTVFASAGTGFPADAEWEKAPEYRLISADRMTPKLQAGGSFRLLASKERLFIRAELQEPLPAKSKTDPKHASGNEDIWKDNCIELFFFAEKSRKFWQIIVNDNNAWSSVFKGRVLPRWIQMKGLQVKTHRKADGWTADISIPLKELKNEGNTLRFNFTRERNIDGIKQENSTWSPLAMVGNWHAADNYGTLIFKQEQP